jgi:hypothetical protein
MHVLIAVLLFILVCHCVPWFGRMVGCVFWLVVIVVGLTVIGAIGRP